MNETKNAPDLPDAEAQVKAAPIPIGQVHTWLLPVTVVAPEGTGAQMTRLSDEVQKQIETLITAELRRLA